MAEASMEVTVRKRVRFAEEPPEVHIVAADDSPREEPQPRKRIWMQADDEDDEDEVESASFPAPEASSMDPAVAATKRSQQRKETADMHLQEDAGLLDDVAAAEEDYEEPEEAFNEVGIPIEPFHLKREREEGYFDAEGNYIQYRLDDGTHDAWLDSITEQPVKLDPVLARTLQEKAASGAEKAPEVPDEDDKLVLKRRMLQLLQPGETVLQALRRLGGRAHGAVEGAQRHRPRRQGAAARQATDISGNTEGAALTRKDGVHGQNSTVPPENRAVFDRLVEYADGLLGAGEFGIYSMRREDLEAAVARQLQPPLQPATATAPVSKDPDMDMFADANGEEPAAPSTPGGTGAAAAAVTVAAGGLSMGGSGTEGLASAAVPMESGSWPGAGSPKGNPVASESGAVLGGGLGNEGAAAAEAGAGDMESRDQDLGFQVAGKGSGGQGLSPMDTDMADAASPGDSLVARPAKARRRSVEMTDAPLACGMSSSHGGSPEGRGDVKNGGEAGVLPQEGGGLAGMDPAVQDVLTGFILDESSGYWYSSDLGCYYDPSTQLFGDASSGVWYKYDGAQYEVAM